MNKNILASLMQIEVINNSVNEIVKTMEGDKNEQIIKYCYAYCSNYLFNELNLNFNRGSEMLSMILNEITKGKYVFEVFSSRREFVKIGIINENIEISFKNFRELFDVISDASLGIDLNPNKIYDEENDCIE